LGSYSSYHRESSRVITSIQNKMRILNSKIYLLSIRLLASACFFKLCESYLGFYAVKAFFAANLGNCTWHQWQCQLLPNFAFCSFRMSCRAFNIMTVSSAPVSPGLLSAQPAKSRIVASSMIFSCLPSVCAPFGTYFQYCEAFKASRHQYRLSVNISTAVTCIQSERSAKFANPECRNLLR
jgi:hypothetical protein